MSNQNDITALVSLLTRECAGCPMSTERLRVLLSVYGTVKSAAYHACLELAASTQTKTSGSTTPEQREYWLTLAQSFRPSRTGTVRRADNA